MKSPIKKIKSQRLKIHRQMAAWLQPQVSHIGRRWRLAARIRLLNGKAARHSRRTFALVVGCLLLLFVANFTWSTDKDENAFALSEIAPMEPLFEGFRHIQANKTMQQDRLMSMATEGKALEKPH